MQRPWSPPAPAFNPGGGGQLPMQPQSAFGGGRHQTYQGQQPGGGPTYSPPPQVQQPPMPELGSIQPIGTIENRAELK